MAFQRVTRGTGILENWLSKKRSDVANKIIRSNKNRRLLDIGCGSFPYFLSQAVFAEKFGIDKTITKDKSIQIAGGKAILKHFDIEKEQTIPFDDHFFDVITMLAVIEHLNTHQCADILAETRRILKPNGLLFITTPAVWSHGLLKAMSLINLVSREEILEHKVAYSHKSLQRILCAADFTPQSIRYGYFEFGLNLWISAVK